LEGGICISTICSDRQVFTEDQGRAEHHNIQKGITIPSVRSEQPDRGCGCLGVYQQVVAVRGGGGRRRGSSTTMSTSIGTILGSTILVLPIYSTPLKCAVPWIPNILQVETSSLESVCQQHSAAGVSEETLVLLFAGWSAGTNSAYQTGWKRWSNWCQRRQVDPVSCRVQPFLESIV